MVYGDAGCDDEALWEVVSGSGHGEGKEGSWGRKLG